MTLARKTVLVLTSTFPRWANDTEPRFILDLCKYLTRYADVEVIAPHHAGAETNEILEGIHVRRFRYAPAPLESLAYRGGMLARVRARPARLLLLPLFALGLMLITIRQLRRRHYTTIHAHWIIPQGLLSALLKGLFKGLRRPFPNLVCTSHGSDLNQLQSFFWRATKRYTLSRCDATTIVGHALQRALPDGVCAAVIPMGTDLASLFTPDERVVRAQNQLIFVGRLVQGKGVDYLISALPAVLRSFPDVQLWIAGEGPSRQELEAQVEHLRLSEHVTFLGSVPQYKLPDLYRRATIAVFPFTRDEGLGLVAVEAQGCRCPVVTTDIPATRDIIPDDSLGWRVTRGSANALATAIKQVMALPSSERHRITARGRVHALSHFDWANVAARYADVLLPNADADP